MSNRVVIIKNGNEIEVSGRAVKGLKINFMKGSENNLVRITEPHNIQSSSVLIAGNDNTVEIMENCEIRNVDIMLSVPADGRKCLIGKNFSFYGGKINVRAKDNSVVIGDNCLFSSGIDISTEDECPIYDIFTKELCNKGGTVNIGNNVWLGYDAAVCKNVSVADHLIVGACSFVTKSIDESYCIAAGIPAKVIKRGVDFSRLTIDCYTKRSE